MKKVILGTFSLLLVVLGTPWLLEGVGIHISLGSAVALRSQSRLSGSQVKAWPLFEEQKARQYLPKGVRLLDLSSTTRLPIALGRTDTVSSLKLVF